ncbi:hypothetical protein [Candidatus Nanohalococcus occultus]|uniref:Capsule polysaccharide biosynthesis protein n=1 Tax=Candidatus Nanohalococcus occultus TaxID=2978047 RepID=A0ABY8CFR7_9ARCH|nr:hypothetical protein SVXNc_1080 [Candidatus Nanohaloarchaeota archaeon SVXNc]
MSEDVVETLLEIEKDLGLLDQQIREVYFWERIRNLLTSRIKAEKGLTNSNSNGISQKRLILKRMYLLVKNVFFRNPLLAKESEVMFVGIPRRKKQDGSWRDIYCDPIIEKFELDYVLFEESHPSRNTHKTPSTTEKIRYLDLIYYLAAIPRLLGFGKPKLSKNEAETLNALEKTLNQRLDVEIDIEEEVVHQISRRKFLLPLYRILLRIVNPECLIMVRPGRRTLLEACKIEDVEVVELQHGTITRRHLEYSSSNGSLKNCPDRMLLWGTFWRENCDFSIEDEHLHLVGYPFLSDRISRSENREGEKILFLSQWDIGEELAKIAVNLSKTISEEIVFKLHPEEYRNWSKKYPRLYNSDVEVVEDADLYKLFSESKLQVGVYSTAIYEGLAFNLRTVIVDLPGSENMSSLIDQEGIHNVETASEIRKVVNEEEEVLSFDRDLFFEPKPYEKLEQIFDELGVKH